MAGHITPTWYLIGLLRLLTWIVGIFWLARSVIKPDPNEHLRWYDRLIRALGVLILGTLMLFGIPRWLGWLK